MTTYSTNLFTSGLKVMLSGEPHSILENQFVKPGKGQAFSRVKLRNLKTMQVIERTFKSGETLEAADVQDIEMVYLYVDQSVWHFMAQDGSYEQYTANEQQISAALPWIQEEDVCQVVLYNGAILSVAPPQFVELRVEATEPVLKGATVTGTGKPATLSTGAQIRVPVFVDVGDIIRIDTGTSQYVQRIKR